MKNLRSVDIICGYQVWDALVPSHFPTDKHPLCLLVQSLQTPNLESLSISVVLELEFESGAHSDSEAALPVDLSSAVFAFTPSSKAQLPAQRLHLSVHGSKRMRCCRILLSVPFERFPALCNLSINIEGVIQVETPYDYPDSDSTPSAFPALKSIRFVKCWGGVQDFLCSIMENQNEEDREDGLRVSVKHCPFVKEGELLKYVAKKNLVFKECRVADALQAQLEVCEILSCPASSSKRSALPKAGFSAGELVLMYQ